MQNFIADATALLTSANLTETAFTKRREIGVLLENEESSESAKRFEYWWSEASAIDDATIESAEKDRHKGVFPEPYGQGLPVLWPLPQAPPPDKFEDQQAAKLTNYLKFLANYREVAEAYLAVQRLWLSAPLT